MILPVLVPDSQESPPNIYIILCPYAPPSTILNYIPGLEDSFPRIRLVGFNISIQNRPNGEKSRLEDFAKQQISVMNQSPHLFGQ